jgi:hypothetical protein
MANAVYIEGMKGHERHFFHWVTDNIADSVTPAVLHSWWILQGLLVPHSAEIDYLDRKRPWSWSFQHDPSNQRNHAGRFESPPTKWQPTTTDTRHVGTLERHEKRSTHGYVNDIIPKLERAAPWFSFAADPDSLSYSLTFRRSVKVSIESLSRRSETLLSINSEVDWGKWKDHVQKIKSLTIIVRPGQSLREQYMQARYSLVSRGLWTVSAGLSR